MQQRSIPCAPVLLFAFALLILNGCGKPCPRENTYHDLSASTIGFVPYEGIFSFRMRDSTGEVTTYVSSGTRIRYEVFEECAECCHDAFYELRTWIFRGSDPSMDLRIGLGRQWSPDPELELSTMAMSIGNAGIFRFNLFTDSIVPFSPDQFVWLDSVRIQGLTHADVIHSWHGRTLQGVYWDSLWYDKTHGLLKFSLSDGRRWELLP